MLVLLRILLPRRVLPGVGGRMMDYELIWLAVVTCGLYIFGGILWILAKKDAENYAWED